MGLIEDLKKDFLSEEPRESEYEELERNAKQVSLIFAVNQTKIRMLERLKESVNWVSLPRGSDAQLYLQDVIKIITEEMGGE